MEQITLEDYLSTPPAPPREPTYKELKARLEATERHLRSLEKRYKKLSATASNEYRRGFDAGCKASYRLGYLDGKKGLMVSFTGIPRRIRQHRLSLCRTEEERTFLKARYDAQDLSY